MPPFSVAPTSIDAPPAPGLPGYGRQQPFGQLAGQDAMKMGKQDGGNLMGMIQKWTRGSGGGVNSSTGASDLMGGADIPGGAAGAGATGAGGADSAVALVAENPELLALA